MSRKRELWERLIHQIAEIESELAAALQSGHGLGLSEYRALRALSMSPTSELRLQELASQLRLNQSSVSRMVERLERRQLVARDPCPDDKRGIYAVLTDTGREVFNRASADYEAALNAAFDQRDSEELLATRLFSADIREHR
ncbi:MarR family winged helix-turn-helix transcriptional regulator [Ruegeria profundi]|uniref:MarR family winged helix-turn-helix transcriptional regulator n=1 Tax=Ruegeria profundi TaxID=1685378 RepID=UPI001CD64234|nr:MarR family transcriptional regulator [Ruegeria profundi]MCA0927636.1 MarR family transcriptional regulator [Ruegeria profundi]